MGGVQNLYFLIVCLINGRLLTLLVKNDFVKGLSNPVHKGELSGNKTGKSKTRIQLLESPP